jgi:hypothetical protein
MDLYYQELELLVCGSPEIDVELLKVFLYFWLHIHISNILSCWVNYQQHAAYRGCTAMDTHIINFWKVLTAFNQTERAQFLRFVWGRSRLPPPSKFKNNFTIAFDPRISDQHLPKSHTWYFPFASEYHLTIFHF